MSKKKKKIVNPSIKAVSVYCPKLKRNVRVPADSVNWEIDYRYEQLDLWADFQCSCGESHTIMISSLSVPYGLKDETCEGEYYYPDWDVAEGNGDCKSRKIDGI